MHPTRQAMLIVASFTPLLGLTGTDTALAADQGRTADAAVTVQPGLVRPGDTVTVTSTAPCRSGAITAGSRAFTHPSVALTAVTGRPQASGTATVRRSSWPGTYRVTVSCAGRTAATGRLTIAAARLYRVVNVHKGHVLNVRSGPGTQYGVIRTLRSDAARVQATGKTRRHWAQVSTGGRTGWAYQGYLRPTR